MHQGTKHYATFRGFEISVIELSRIAGVNRTTLLARCKAKWNMDAAVVATPDDRVNTKTSAVWAQQSQVIKQADIVEKGVIAFFKRINKKTKVRYPTRKAKRSNQKVLTVPVVANAPQDVESWLKYLVKEIKTLKSK